MDLYARSVAIIGCGNMGGAIARGLRSSDLIKAGELTLWDTDKARAEALAAETGASVAPIEAARAPRLVVIAVKPAQTERAIRALELTSHDLVVSIAAGIPWRALDRATPSVRGVVRAMPNTPSLVGHGVTALYSKDEGAAAAAAPYFEALGEVIELGDESLMHAIIGVAGSAPAYHYIALEALADAAVAHGLDRASARRAAARTMLGAAAMALQVGEHTGALKDRVSSPGGTTIRAVAALERAGLRAAYHDAVDAAAERSRAMERGGQN